MASHLDRSNGQSDEHTLFAALEATVAPALLAGKRANDTVRVWVPGCETGELVYAVASVLCAQAEQHISPPAIQIFATDTRASAITFARHGRYFNTLSRFLPSNYIQRYFRQEEQQYQVTTTVRELITFAQHDVLRDPPFAHLDLIVCGKALSAFSEDEQEQLIDEFHWCLQPNGYLLPGTHESISYLSQLFAATDAVPSVFQRRDVVTLGLPVPRYSLQQEWQSIEGPLQEVNEHLLAMNQVLRRKVGEFGQATSDLSNLMSATNLAIIFLDQQLQVTRFTNQAAQLFNLIHNDRGRPLSHIRHTLDYKELVADAANTLTSLHTIEREAQSTDGHWYLVRLRAYHAVNDPVKGVVLICVDITERRLAEMELRRARDELEQRVAERTKELRTANTQLQVEIVERTRLEQERAELLRALVSSQEDERRRIARELHDQLGQSISALTVGLSMLTHSALQDGNRQQTVARLQHITAQIDRDMERLARDLRPVLLDDLGLVDALQQHVEQWTEHSGIPADFVLIERESGRLPYEIESVVYRVIQEALTNVLKHAAAHKVSVILERRHDQTRVIVEDDGQGFDLNLLEQAPNVHQRLGLLGMRERVALVGGTLQFETAPGAGTTLFVQIPTVY